MTTAPPHDWRILNGTWGTDADLVTSVTGAIASYADGGGGTVTVTAAGHSCLAGMYVRITGSTNYNGQYVVFSVVDGNNFKITTAWIGAGAAGGTWQTGFSGKSFILFENTTPAADPYLMLTAAKFVEVEEGYPIQMEAVVQADSIAATHTCTASIAFYLADKSYLSEVVIRSAAVLSVAGEWITISGVANTPVGARYASPYVLKNNTAFHLALDTMGIRRMPVAAFAYGGSTTIPDSSTTQIEFDTEDYDYGDIYDNTTDYEVTIPVDGLYDFTASVRVTHAIDTFNSGDDLLLYLYKNNAYYMTLGDRTTDSSDATVTLHGTTGPLYATRGSVFDVRVGYVPISGTDDCSTSGDRNTRLVVAKVE